MSSPLCSTGGVSAWRVVFSGSNLAVDELAWVPLQWGMEDESASSFGQFESGFSSLCSWIWRSLCRLWFTASLPPPPPCFSSPSLSLIPAVSIRCPHHQLHSTCKQLISAGGRSFCFMYVNLFCQSEQKEKSTFLFDFHLRIILLTSKAIFKNSQQLPGRHGVPWIFTPSSLQVGHCMVWTLWFARVNAVRPSVQLLPLLNSEAVGLYCETVLFACYLA